MAYKAEDPYLVGSLLSDAGDDRASSEKLLACERCGGRAASDAAEARSLTYGWRNPLYCRACEAWWWKL